jgi:hypothetical protein
MRTFPTLARGATSLLDGWAFVKDSHAQTGLAQLKRSENARWPCSYDDYVLLLFGHCHILRFMVFLTTTDGTELWHQKARLTNLLSTRKFYKNHRSQIPPGLIDWMGCDTLRWLLGDQVFMRFV